jgi:geranylgeranyl pyrophosphate synthase
MFMQQSSQKTRLIDKSIENFLPKKSSGTWFSDNLQGDCKLGSDVYDALVSPIWDLLNRGGKRWRPFFMIICCNSFNGSKAVYDFIPLIELLHNATLIIDDIEDSSKLRRGKPCVHRKFGIDLSINSSNFIYFLPYLIIQRSSTNQEIKDKISKIVSEEMLKLHIGQAMDISWHNSPCEASEEMYLQMCAFKTGTLVRLAAKIGAIAGGANKKEVKSISNFAESIGIAFQIQDDILNIAGNIGKETGEDISEGKKSLMVVHTLEKANKTDAGKLGRILSSKTRNKRLIKEAISLLDKYHSIDFARKKAKDIVQCAWDKLDPLIKESKYKQKLRSFADFVVDREV